MATRYQNLATEKYNGHTIFKTQGAFPQGFFNRFNPTIIVVDDTMTLDGLACEYYNGDGSLWWLIALANNLMLGSASLTNGMLLLIPMDSKSAISAVTNYNNT